MSGFSFDWQAVLAALRARDPSDISDIPTKAGNAITVRHLGERRPSDKLPTNFRQTSPARPALSGLSEMSEVCRIAGPPRNPLAGNDNRPFVGNVGMSEGLRTAAGDPAPVPLDAEGLPEGCCPACGAGDLWKPAGLPPEGPGWRCEACDPAPADLLRHGCAVPVGWRPEPDPDLVNELAEERAAIMEHDGGFSRAEAEAAAGLVRRRSSPE